MHPWKRPPEPEELRAQRRELTRAFVLKQREPGTTPRFKWPELRNPDGNLETIQSMLARHTGGHCNYCDNLIDSYSGRHTIDHFLPKSHFPCLAYVWKNLYLCCDGCQRKVDRHDKTVLRPDELGYDFHLYFRYARDGQILVIAQGEEERCRAEKTVEVLDLQDPALIKKRCGVFNQGLMPRRRPAPVGLDGKAALAREDCLQVSHEDKPFRAWFSQDEQT